MKKILIVAFLLLIATNCFCQDLTFLGIPIKGSKANFTKELLNKGFELIPEDEEEALSGLFLGEPCILKPQIDENGEMRNVSVILFPNDHWSPLFVKYRSMRAKLIKELGEPSKEDAYFDMPIQPDLDIEKYQALTDGKCKYECLWYTPNIGGVSLSIYHLISGHNCVLITYLREDPLSTNISHMKFKGISLGETPYNFMRALVDQGYTYYTEVDNTYILKGTFAGYSNCQLFVKSAQYDNTVEFVAINFPNETRWEYLHNTYSKLKDLMTQKYGEPASCIEKFNSSSVPTSEYKIMSLLKNDEYKYETVYLAKGGYIKLIISHLYVNYEHSYYVGLIYVDGATSISTEKRAIDDL